MPVYNMYIKTNLLVQVIRGTPERLLSQLIDENSTADATYVEDFLLTHRTFMESSLSVAERLLEWFDEGSLCDRVTRVLLLWVRRRSIRSLIIESSCFASPLSRCTTTSPTSRPILP